MPRKYVDLLFMLALVVANLFWVLSPALSIHTMYAAIIGALLALPLVFIVPGYLLTELWPPKKDIDLLQRFLLSIGMSLTFDILGGFLLNVLPGGLSALSWVLLISFLFASGAVMLLYQRRDRTERARFSQLNARLWLSVGLCALGGIATVVGIMYYDAYQMEKQPYAGFTQFWLLPAPQTGSGCTVDIGLQSYEKVSSQYRIVMLVNAMQVNAWSPALINSQQGWKQSVPLPLVNVNYMSVDALLYQSTHPEQIYRHVHVYLHITGDGSVAHPHHCQS